MAEQVPSSDITSDDKLWALLAYIFSPLIPIVVLLLEDKKKRPFIMYHSIQALVVGIVFALLWILIGWTLILACIPFLVWVVMIYWGIQAYQGNWVVIPVITNFVKNQGWA
jgi:uncharacterized membrane protein